MEAPFAESIDIRTLVIAVMVVYLGSFFFSLALFIVRRTFRGAGQWILGQACLLIGVLGTGAEIFGLPYDILALANVALVTSILLLGHAIWLFRARTRFPLYLYLLVPLSVFMWFIPGEGGLSTRILYFSGILGLLASWNASLLLRRPEPGYTRVFVSASVFFILVALAGFGRVAALFLGTIPASLAQQGRMGVAEYAIAVLAAFFNLFGYFLMSAVRTEKELMESELAIRHRNERLNSLVAMKDALITVVGHDLRAPIASAARYTRNHLLGYEGDLNDKRESVATLAEGLERAAALLANLVDWARSASGRMEFDLIRVNLADLAREAVHDLAAVAERKGLSVSVEETDTWALADPRATTTVFRNIIANAIKYSKQGGAIRVEFSALADGRVTAAIIDNGVGMDRGQIESLFEPGRTIQTLGTDGEQGTGMGLALCKAFMETMGGDIQVSSIPGSGSRFETIFHPSGSESARTNEASNVDLFTI